MKAVYNQWSLKAVIDNCEDTSFEQKEISSRYTESVFKFKNDSLITGNIYTFITQDIEVSKMNIRSANDISVLQTDGVERYVSTFVHTGNIQTEIKEVKQSLHQQSRQHSFVHANIEEGEHVIQAGDTSLLYINIKPVVLHQLFPDWCNYTRNYYHRNGQRKVFIAKAIKTHQNINMQQLLMTAENKMFNNYTRHLYVEAKAMELLALQIEEIVAGCGIKPVLNIISKADKEKLVALYEYVNDNFLEPLTLSQLAKKFTLNEFKIKKGFKQLYSQTVFGYILSLRMQKAKQLLTDGNMTVSEVSDLVGYSSVHNFSNSFFKMYNYRPNKLRHALIDAA